MNTYTCINNKKQSEKSSFFLNLKNMYLIFYISYKINTYNNIQSKIFYVYYNLIYLIQIWVIQIWM